MYSLRRRGALFATPLLLAGALIVVELLPSSAGADTAQAEKAQACGAETITPLRDLTAKVAGEPLLYLSTPRASRRVWGM